MSKLAYGPASWHVQASSGPPLYPLHFYSTTYSIQHGRQGGLTGRGALRHRGTGYASNFRPAVYYSPRLDAIDNPHMGKLLHDNYDSLTRKDYVGYVGSDGGDPFPSQIQPGSSGFAHNLPRTIPTSRQASCVHINTARDGSVPVYPRQNPLLHSLKPKDPVSTENAGHGPSAMSTEYHTKFPRQPFRDEGLDVSGHSHKEETGFTHAWNVEPVTFRPHENFACELPGYITWRPTGSSIMKRDFRNTFYLKGSEPLPSVTGRSDRSNGYVKGSKAMADVQPKASEMVGYTRASQLHPTVLQRVKKEDPAEFTNVTHPQQYTSLTQRSFPGVGWNEGGRLTREEVGGKELTGFSENNDPMVEPRDRDTQRFSTHYQGRFSNPNPVCSPGMVPSSHPGVQPPLKNGFSKSTQVHRFAPPLDTGRMLRGIDPYVARSILKRHPYFDDHTHDNKAHTL